MIDIRNSKASQRIGKVERRRTQNFAREDGLLLMLGALCISIAIYHPFYFGDELFSFAFGMHHGDSFAGTFNELNSYKPRVIMNALWAVIVSNAMPRWLPMLVNSLALGGCAWLTYVIATNRLQVGRLAAFLAAALVLISRFNVMLYYDYVSGTVESLSLMFFLTGFLLAANAILDGAVISRGRALLSFLFFIAAVLVHERYVAGIAGMFAFSLLPRLSHILKSRNWRSLILPVGSVLATGLAVVVLVKTMSNNPVTMGTSGRTVTVTGATLHVALTYLQNLFLGANYGPDWFVGLINQGNPSAGKVFRVFGLLFGLAWLVPWILRWKNRTGTEESFRPGLQRALPLLGFVLGMVAVASLPGADRQEARWMYPAISFVSLLVLVLYTGFSRYVLFALFAVSQAFYLWFGSLDRIASINGSETAQRIGRAMDVVDFPGRAGIMISVPEPDTSWVIGGNDGAVFCQVNLSPRNCVVSRGKAGSALPQDYAFGLVPQGLNRRGDWSYRFISKEEVDVMLDPSAIPEGGIILGNAGTWTDWVIGNPEMRSEQGLLLKGLAENFIRRDVVELDSRMLVYKAKAVSGSNVPMRLQVNWHDKENKFLGASIEVVEVGAKEGEYAMRISAPENASFGNIYATLHADGKGTVLLTGLRLVDL